MTVEQHGPLPVGNFWAGRDGLLPDKIVLHTMVGWIAAADARFHNPTSYVSAHFGVRVDGSLWQWVNVWDSAYHAGDFVVNLDSIGIEHEDGGDFNGVRPDALYSRSAALVAQLCRENGIPIVRGQKAADGTFPPGIYDHRQIVATGCPDALDTDRIIAMAVAINAPTPEPPHDPAVDATVVAPAAAAVDVVHEWAALYKQEGPRAGIRAELALAQALHETGNFTFLDSNGNVPASGYNASWNNPAGLGVTGGVGIGNRFTTKREGVVAQFQHLLMYFTPAHTAYCVPTVDQRHYAHRGYANDAHQLDGHWAVPGNGYADAILALVPRARQLLAES